MLYLTITIKIQLNRIEKEVIRHDEIIFRKIRYVKLAENLDQLVEVEEASLHYAT